MSYIGKIILALLYKMKGKRDCLSYAGDKRIKNDYLSGLESYLITYAGMLVTNFNADSKYSISNMSDNIDFVIGKFNARLNEIQEIFQYVDEHIVAMKSLAFHWIIILSLFLMDALITQSILEVIFPTMGRYEMYIILVGFFVVVLSTSINKIGEFFKTGNVLRWPLIVLLMAIFVMLTLIRVYGISEAQDIINPKGYQVKFDDMLFGLLVFAIYVLTTFIGVYFGYKDTYRKPSVFKPLEKEFWERKKIVNTLKIKREKYNIKKDAYNRGWLKGEYLLLREGVLRKSTPRKRKGAKNKKRESTSG